MDVHDVSTDQQFFPHLQRQKQTLENAKKRDGEIPTDRKSTQHLITATMLSHLASSMSTMDMRHSLHSSFVPPPYLPSTTFLAQLQPIYIRELQLGVHHRGRYLLVRVLTIPTRMTAIMVIVEDEKGDGSTLQLYQQPNENIRPTASVVTRGDVFLLKDPFFKIMSDGNYGLRVDHVSDLIRITRHGTYRELMPKFWKGPKSYKSADDWKLQGNDEVGREEYWSAIESYSTALELSTDDEEKQIIRLNRALAHLRNGDFDAALKDTKGLDLLARTKEKALYRMGQAYYQLEDYSSSKAAMQALCDQFPGHQGGTPELARSTLRIAEETTAKIDFKRIYKKISKLRPPHLDHATFTGPIVVKESPGRGQGLFTIREVKAGELLLFEKAFAHCYAAPPEENDNGASKTSILINIHTNQMTMGTQSDLITTIVQKLYKNPSLVPKFQELYHGSYQPADATVCDDKPVVDTFLIERIVSHNVFGCPTLSTYNSLKPLLETGKAEQDIVNHSTGIWLKASKINHSCMSNCHRSFIGDFQIVRATCNIPADTEIHFCYRTPTGDFTEMKKELRTWGFECKCGICEESRTAPKSLLKKRKDSSMNLKRIVANVKAIDLQRLERQLKVYESTFTKSATAAPRIHIFNIYIQLARFWGQAQMPKESVAMALKGLECLGFVIHGAQLPATAGKPFHIEKWGHFQDNVDQAFVFLRDAYAVFAPQLVEKADECAKLAYSMSVGEDVTFDTVYKRGQKV